jgi:hypothetical protein
MIRKIMAAIIALSAMPALAQTSPLPEIPGPMASDPTPGPYAEPSYGGEAFAAVPIAPAPGSVGPIAQRGIYACGQYLGWDPDPNIRLQLLRDACINKGD